MATINDIFPGIDTPEQILRAKISSISRALGGEVSPVGYVLEGGMLEAVRDRFILLETLKPEVVVAASLYKQVLSRLQPNNYINQPLLEICGLTESGEATVQYTLHLDRRWQPNYETSHLRVTAPEADFPVRLEMGRSDFEVMRTIIDSCYPD